MPPLGLYLGVIFFLENNMDKVVAIEPIDGGMEIIFQDHNESVDWNPWVVHKFPQNDPRGVVRQQKLQGDNDLKFKVTYRTPEAYKSASKLSYVRKELSYQDTRQAFLVDHPEYQLFQNMKFNELKRMVIDIETTGLNPEKDRILMIGYMTEDGRNYYACDDEAASIVGLNWMIQQLDPDIIEGWNAYDFDLPFINVRAQKLGVKLEWGRDGSQLKELSKRNFRVGGFERKIKQWQCHGRHLVDGMLEAMRYDVNTGGKMESYGLKDVAVSLGIRKEGRVLVDASDMVEQWEKNRNKVIEYCLGDVEETYDIGSIVLPPNFYLTSILPDVYQNVLVSGGATKINQILVAEYLRENQSIPINNNESAEFQGGFVELRECGVFKKVYKADVSSLYPSIMLNFDVTPRQDNIGAFKRTLEHITEKRLYYKAKAKTAKDEYEKQYYTGMEKAFKIIINSYYGYMGTGTMNFSDLKAARQVTGIGRMIVNDMADQIEDAGGKVIEIDTDGVFFSGDLYNYQNMEFNLPDGINVDIDSPVEYMVSIKAKNYVLVDNGKYVYHGNSLRSRRDEKFGIEFLTKVVDCLLENNVDKVYDVYKQYQDEIIYSRLPVEDLCKRERITDKIDIAAKRRLKAAVEETDLHEGDYIKVYQRQDGTLAPIETFTNDIDNFYYLDRLYKFACRLEDLLATYDIILPRIDKRTYKKLYSCAAIGGLL